MLSIIIPTLNEEKCLPDLLKSIKGQDFKDYEVIVADAGSNDRTVAIAKDYNCKVIEGGLPARGRNKGADVASGDLILFIDADNKITSNRFLTELIGEFQKRKLGSASFPIYPNGIKFDKFIYYIYNLWVKLSQRFLPHASGAFLVTKEIHKKTGGFDEEIKLAEDHEYIRRSAKHGRFGFIEASPILFSSRRFEIEGRLKTYSKYILAGLYMLFFGPIKSDFFKYRFINSLTEKIE